MHVPAAAGDFHAANAFLDQTASEQTALAELITAILFLQRIRLICEAERLEVGAAHDLDRILIELRIALHTRRLETGAEGAVQLVQQRHALLHDVSRDIRLRVLQTSIGIEDRQWREGRREEAIAVVRLAVHAHTGWQRLMAGSFEMLHPSTHGGMLDRAALLVAGADQILRRGMNTGLRGHAANEADLVSLLREFHHRATELEAGLGLDWVRRTLGVAFFRIKRVDMRHTADHLEEDEVLGLAEPRAGGRIRSGRFGGKHRARGAV